MATAGFRDRVVRHEGTPVVHPSGVPAATIIERLEAGDNPARVVATLGLDAAGLVAALALDALGEEGSEGPPLVQSRPRRPRLGAALGEPAWAALLPSTPRPGRLALAAGLLQLHDFWDASHEAAQQADDLGERPVSAYWHGIAHRREPDSSNASYWFRRVGPHPLFPRLREAAVPLIAPLADRAPVARLVQRGSWDPFAFITLCGDGRPEGAFAALARQLQRAEMLLLLEFTAETLGIA